MAPPRFWIDHIIRFLDRYPLSPLGATLLGALSYAHSRALLGASHTLLAHLRSHRPLAALVGFVAVKAAHRALSRLTRNSGWEADPPRWSFEEGEGEVVVITGGSTGIGKELVDILAKKTDKIAVLDLAPPTYSATNVKFFKCDVTDAAAIADASKQIRAELGHPTILVNNAGIARGKTILDTTADEFLLTYKVNVLGSFNVLREFLPHIVSANHGHIMTMASSAAYCSVAQLADYNCSKAAALSLHETLTEELKWRYNAPLVRTSVICPTKVSTQLGAALEDTDTPFLHPTLTPAWLAGEMARILDSGLSEHLVTPHMALLIGRLENMVTYSRNAEKVQAAELISKLDRQHGLEAVKRAGEETPQ
ncbi:hypothetical protein JCM10207_007924 [Rhodosporidiobolus poonsookiae]